MKSRLDLQGDTAKKEKSAVGYWVREISAAKKREKGFRKDGERVLEIYEGKKSSSTPFNILFSNTETLLPALYSAIPRPVVDRRFKDDDPTGKSAAEAATRMLEFLIDTNVEGYETFDEAMRAATLDALLPGRGVTCEKYDAEVDNLPTLSVDAETPAPVSPAEQTGQPEGEMDSPYKKSELVCSDTRSWNRVYFGYAKKWSKVPWIAFEEDIDKEEATRLFGVEVASLLSYAEHSADDQEDKKADRDEADEGERKLCRVYQIWDKAGGRKIRYISDQFKERFLKVEDDTLQLTGFYNMPRPLSFLEKSNDLLPVSLYILYENQAKELNRIQIRINKIVEAIKARGIYDSELGEDIANLMKSDDNELVPADKSASMAAEKGLQNSIWFMPLDVLVATLQQLYSARESCKQVIYEITGIADIMRGASNASETLGAQEIKQSWGTLRLKRLQKEVQRYARDLLRIKLEIAATKFSDVTWARMTGLPFLTDMRAQQLQSIQMAAQQSQQPLDPATQQEASQPKWADVLALLRDDMQRSYRIDIETNSTVEPEAVEDQKNIADVMNALGQYLNSIGPLVAKGVMPWQAAQAMCLAIIRRFRFGPEIEDYIKQMKAPPPPPDPNAGNAAAAQQAQQQHDMDMQAQQADIAAKQQDNVQKAQLAERDAQLKMAQMDRQAQLDAAEHDARMEEIAAKRQLTAVVTASKLAIARATAAAKEAAVPQGAT